MALAQDEGVGMMPSGSVTQPLGAVPHQGVSSMGQARAASAARRWRNRRPQVEGESLLAADICSGLGGLSEGLRMAGFDVRLALDSSPSALATYQRNNPDTLVALQDLGQLRKFSTYLAAVGVPRGRLSLLAGGTPCQSFSAANSRKSEGRGEHHALVLQFAQLVAESNPLVFLLENVPRVASADGGALLNEFLAKVEQRGYSVETRNLWAHEYGVPQRRRRTFVVGSRIGKYEFMPPTHGPNSAAGKPFVTVGDAILGDLPGATRLEGENPRLAYAAPSQSRYQRWCRVQSPGVTDHVWNNLGPEVVARFSLIGQNRSWSQVQAEGRVPANLRIHIDHRSVYRRLDSSKPAFTIVHVRKAMTIHPTENRLVTMREVARLQSFRDRFRLSGRDRRLRQMSDVQQQLANAVPPLLARAVARRIRRRIER
jgi:DNA (cytosine-5)-methyltransferase 1